MTGYWLGAEAYIIKPTDGLELLARINVIFRRSKMQNAITSNAEFGGLSINWSMQKVFITANNESIEVFFTATEFKILSVLMQNPNRIISRETLLDKVWGNSSHVTDRTVDTHVHSIRKKLESKSVFLKTIPGSGYLFEYNPSA